MRPFLALDPYAPRSSRYLSLIAGVAVFFPFLRLARRLVGQTRAELAGFGLALSPLAIQAATTAASEALYLLLFVAALERLLAALEDQRPRPRAGPFVAAGLLASLAAVTRYDAWLAIPVAAVVAWLAGGRRPGLARGLALFLACAALLPVAWLVWGGLSTDDPIFFAHYISQDHAQLAASAVARYGPVLDRLRQLAIWALSFVAAMSLPLVVGAALGLARWRRLSPAMWVVLAAALAPPGAYLAKGLGFLTFEPLPRFGLIPGALLLPLAATVVPLSRMRTLRATVAGAALAFAVTVQVVAVARPGRIWPGAESLGVLTRLDAEDRALAAYLRAHRRPGEPVMLEPLAFAEIAIAHAAAVPMTQSVTLTVTREPAATVAASMAATGARWVAGYEHPGGWPSRLPDWPADALAFGRWRLAAR
jgi:4-amino-4-deoxy-L-arabinose transferase-like glycosyltransferase